MEGVLTCRWLPGPSLPDGDPLALIRCRLVAGSGKSAGQLEQAIEEFAGVAAGK
jgi:hypothetical protein